MLKPHMRPKSRFTVLFAAGFMLLLVGGTFWVSWSVRRIAARVESDLSFGVAVTGAASCVFRATGIEQALARSFTPQAVRAVKIAPDDLASDLHASAEYRAHLVSVIAARAVERALGNVG